MVNSTWGSLRPSRWIPSRGEIFTAVVSQIANQAEFTPRNVQSVEGRGATVYAITLRVNDPEGKLKPGMLADVQFDQGHE